MDPLTQEEDGAESLSSEGKFKGVVFNTAGLSDVEYDVTGK